MNIVLIGMPGAGKSTIGVLLAKELAYNFVDTDVNIQLKTKESLQDTLNREGFLRLREIEADIVINLEVENTVISTGGSAIYGSLAMEHLKKNSKFIFIEASLKELTTRIHNYQTRGIAKKPDQSFEDLFKERTTLYRKYADITIKSVNGKQNEMVETIVGILNSGKNN